MKRNYDIIFVGGGLASGLAAYRLAQQRPDLSAFIMEQGPSLGGNHTWSFHGADLTTHQHAWMAPFVSHAWPAYDVIFPGSRRTIRSSYHSIRSAHFHDVISGQKKIGVALNARARAVGSTWVDVENLGRFEGRAVIDARGWENSPDIPEAYQKFLGLDVTLREPHGLVHPVLMDAMPLQKDGYRFFYLLPWSERSLLIEDTRYSDSADLDPAAFRAEIQGWIREKGWEVSSIDREEAGALSIPLGGSLPPWSDGLPRAGARAGLFHATTGYSLPHAVRFADAFAALQAADAPRVFEWARAYAETQWRRERSFRLLNRLLFHAAHPSERYKIFEKFYHHPEALLGRFYAGRLRGFDWLRIFSGKPPVSLARAIPCIFEKRRIA